MAETELQRRIGTILRGKWTLERLLGSGGMGAVYLGLHKIGRRDAIKILHPEIARMPELRARFEQEALAVNRFVHPTSELKNYRPPQVTRILARDGTPLAELFVERRTVVPISAVPKVMKLAVLAAEDANFYTHEGLNYFAEIGKVVRVRFTGGDPGSGRLELSLGPQGALVAIDVRTAEVLAVVGSYDAVRGALDRARSAHRQPASTFKPIVYSYGIHTRAFTAASILETDPAALGEKYRPGNYDESDGQSPRRLREALAKSVNVAAVWTLDKLGPAKVAEWARSLGIASKLGGAEGSLEEVFLAGTEPTELGEGPGSGELARPVWPF